MIRERPAFSKRVLAVLAVLLLLLFIGLTGLVVAGATDRLDLRLSRVAERPVTPRLTALLDGISSLAQPLVALLALPVAALLWRRHYRRALLIAGSALGSAALNLVLKAVLRHPPPGDGANYAPDWHGSPLHILESISDNYSYPSGHVQATVVALGLWLLCLWPLLPRIARLFLPLVCLGFFSILAYSRVYLGHHFATDVVGGALLGAAWLAGTVLAIERTGDGANRR